MDGDVLVLLLRLSYQSFLVSRELDCHDDTQRLFGVVFTVVIVQLEPCSEASVCVKLVVRRCKTCPRALIKWDNIYVMSNCEAGG